MENKFAILYDNVAFVVQICDTLQSATRHLNRHFVVHYRFIVFRNFESRTYVLQISNELYYVCVRIMHISVLATNAKVYKRFDCSSMYCLRKTCLSRHGFLANAFQPIQKRRVTKKSSYNMWRRTITTCVIPNSIFIFCARCADNGFHKFSIQELFPTWFNAFHIARFPFYRSDWVPLFVLLF